jgi:hypothetical protein
MDGKRQPEVLIELWPQAGLLKPISLSLLFYSHCCMHFCVGYGGDPEACRLINRFQPRWRELK